MFYLIPFGALYGIHRNPLLILKIKGLAQVSRAKTSDEAHFLSWFRDCSLVIRFYKFPNNWGAFTTLYGILTSANGAMAVSSQVPTLLEAQPTGGTSYEVLNYSADRVSSIYGNSSTVQPAALRVLALIRAY